MHALPPRPSVALLALALAASASCLGCQPTTPAARIPEPLRIASPWTLNPGNPILSGSLADAEKLTYNDPCVLKAADSSFVMYLSRDVDRGARAYQAIASFRAVSTDGLSWSVGGSPVLAPGSMGEWDYNAAETPCVVEFGGKYHLYYSGISEGDAGSLVKGRYRIGHATSTDGLSWTKDAANPVLDETEAGLGGALHVAEPGAVVVGSLLVLYFTVTKADGLSIWRSESTDGSSFSAPVEILAKGPTWVDPSYLGYSTPCAVWDGARYHLFYDLYQQGSAWNGASSFQVALIHAGSEDGVHFVEEAGAFLTRGEAPWTARELRSPWVLVDGPVWRLWFAGDNYLITGESWTGRMGIGSATAPAAAMSP